MTEQSARIAPTWAKDPNIHSRETITLCDVIGTAGSQKPGNTVNSISLTLGIAATGETYSQDALLYTPSGLTSIPLGPGQFDSSGNFTPSSTSISGTQAVAYVRDDQWIVLGTRDTRTQFTPGNLAPGETSVYATGSAARTIYKIDGSVTHMTIASDGSGNQVYLSISPTALTFMAPWGRLVFDATGFHVATTSGAQLDLGSMNAPGLPPSVSSFCNINAGTVSIPASTVNLGPPGPLGYQQVVYPLAPVVPGIPLPMFSSTACSSVYVGL